MNEIDRIKADIDKLKEDTKKIPLLEAQIANIEAKSATMEQSIKRIEVAQKEGHEELKESHVELKESQDKIADDNLEQTKILNRIEERYQSQIDTAQKNEDRALTHSKWLLGALWGVISVVLIAVISGLITTIF